MMNTEEQRLGKDFERLRLLSQKNLSDKSQADHGGHCDLLRQPVAGTMSPIHVLKVQMPYRDTFLIETERNISTSASAGGRALPRQS